MSRRYLAAALCLGALGLGACSAASDPSTFGASSGLGGGVAAGSGAGGASSGHPAGSTTTGFLDAGSGSGSGSGAGSPGCAAELSSVYTLAADNSLYRFDPPSLTFSLIGVLNCPSVSSPFSMAVDRHGFAWVVFVDGHLFKVNVANAACEATGFVPGQSGFTTFGMGFSADAPGSAAETLFVSQSGFSTTTIGLAKIDTGALTLTPIGMYDSINARAELTGTGDARLFGAFEGTPYVVAEIVKSSAHIVSQAPQSAINYPPDTSNFAFAFWGGDFYLFVGPGSSTDVFHYKKATDGTTAKVSSVAFEIVGAGVSTCAPFVPPT